jgi:cytochrome P450
VIPMTTWALLDVLRSGNIKKRLLAEIDPCFGRDSLKVDITRLCSLPLFSSIYMETLRLRGTSASARQPLAGDFRLGNWLFKKGSTIFAMPWIAGRDPKFWNTGRSDDPHPVTDFWAERFLDYPGDLSSGPARKHDQPEVYAAKTGKPAPARTSEEDRTAKLVTTGIQGHWFPYGGGIKMCPGRFFAKQEMMGAVAVLMRVFDIELSDPVAAEKIGLDFSRFPFGTLNPNRKIPVRIRRRKLVDA